ncbi:MAG: hypothetical protein HY684_04270 [Chloroflexi bacterium]|nr:hypothetical protein [Chloroflexota bacterium]
MAFPLLFLFFAALGIWLLFGRRDWFTRPVATVGLLSALLALAVLGVGLVLYWSAATRLRPESLPNIARNPAAWDVYLRWARSTFWAIWLGAPAAGVVAALLGAWIARTPWWQPVAFSATVVAVVMVFLTLFVEIGNACTTGSAHILIGAITC